jgi:hypothetical protein
LVSGGEPDVEFDGEDCIESVELAGGVAASEGELGVLGGGALDCIEVSEGGADVSGPVACCREQAAASVSALRLKINKPRFIEHLAIVNGFPAALSPGGTETTSHACQCSVDKMAAQAQAWTDQLPPFRRSATKSRETRVPGARRHWKVGLILENQPRVFVARLSP